MLSRNIRLDLHVHTTRSDGRLNYRECIDRLSAAQRKPAATKVIAFTDHNVPVSSGKIRSVKEELGDSINILPGIEIDTYRGDPTLMENGLHILGYGIDENSALSAKLQQVLEARTALCETFLRVLSEQRIIVRMEDVLASAKGEAPKPYDYYAAARRKPSNSFALSALGTSFNQQKNG